MRKRAPWGVLAEIIFVLLACAYVFPLYLLVINSLKSYQDIIQNPYLLPKVWLFQNYAKVVQQTELLAAMGRSVIVTFASVVVIVFSTSLCAYALIRRRGRLNRYLYYFFLAGILIPFQAYMIPLVREFQLLGILRTPIALVITYVAQFTPLAIFIYSGYFTTVPRELEEAAIIDGAGAYQLFFKIIFRLVTPCTASVVIIFSINVWNSFIQPMTIMGNLRWRSLFMEILFFVQDQYFRQWNLTFAACVLALLPLALVYFVMQKRIIGGLTSGAIKQ
jgi:raffinose/stachyose/melibiose transport system permease protein